MIWGGIKYILSFLALFVFFFLLLNFPAYWRKIKFSLNPVKLGQPIVLEQLDLAPKNEPEPPPVPEEENNRLKIAKIDVNVPVVWDTHPDSIIEKLRDGVVHYQGTALPGENGNVFITGHSSNFWWDKGKFNNIFATLDKMEIGDEIEATYGNKRYKYIVEKKFVVDPSHIEVLNPSDHSIISLMTCTPVGTTINRLIVQAKQVSPEPAEVTVNQPPSLPNRLPAVR